MPTLRKLTLSVDEKVIKQARRYSRRHNVSISKLVSNYLAGLADGQPDRRFSRTVQRLKGILPPTADVQEHRDHLEKKYVR